MTRRHRPRLAMSSLVGCLLLVGAWAAAQRLPRVSFMASVSNTRVTLGEEIQLTFHIVLSADARVQRFLAPSLRDFEVRDTAIRRRPKFTFGVPRPQHLSIEDRIYLLRPRREGRYVIEPAALWVDGRMYRSRPLRIRVEAPRAGVPQPSFPRGYPRPSTGARAPQGRLPSGTLPGGAGAAPPLPGGAGPGGAVSAPRSGGDDLFLQATADKESLYVGEQVTVTWHVYTQSSLENYRPLKAPKTEAFWSEDLYLPRGRLRYRRTQHRGQEYMTALLLKKALFPLRAGTLTVGTLEAEFVTQASLFVAPTGSTRQSPPLRLEVKPLPQAGRPPGFDPGNVGRYEMAARLDRAQAAVGEAVTLTITATGRGNLRQLTLPRLTTLEGFKVYPPKTDDQVELKEVVQGRKTAEYLIVPQRGGDLTVPPLGLPCFDPDLGEYVTPQTAALHLTVVGTAPTPVSAPGAAGPAENLLQPQIALLRNRHSITNRAAHVWLRPWSLALILGVPPVLLLGLVVGERLRRLARRETFRSRRRRARSGARRRLRAAELLSRSGDRHEVPAFYAELTRALYDHLEAVLAAPLSGLTRAELGRYLRRRGFPEETTEAVVHELENCDFARFASAAHGPEELKAAVKRVRKLLPEIERAPARDAADEPSGEGGRP